MPALDKHQLDRFAEAVQTLRLYRRAELASAQGDDLIEALYVDPLPHNFVHTQLTLPATTFLIGRKGTGKSTIFLRAEKTLHSSPDSISTYVDIKTVYESAQTDSATVSKLDDIQSALSPGELAQHRLTISFIKAIVDGIRSDLQKQLKGSWKKRFKEAVTGQNADIFDRLDQYLSAFGRGSYIDVQAVKLVDRNETADQSKNSSATLGLSASSGAAPAVTANGTISSERRASSADSYQEILLRTLDLRELIGGIKQILDSLGTKHLYVFVDDFSELPIDAMKSVVDFLIAPLNNWSDELVKFKIAAYPGRIYYGNLDKTKIDEVSLDLYDLYGTDSLADMVEKGVDFTKRLVSRRLEQYGLAPHDFIEDDLAWRALFEASAGNPRVLGYTLYFAHANRVIYDRAITAASIREAAQRYYEEKVEPYFAMGAFLHESFEEKSSIFSLKELLEQLVAKARHLRVKSSSSIFSTIRGKHPTSHFHITPSYESILSSLELNFFVTKYYSMTDRDGRKVSVYSLNYGLCAKYQIAFGRPDGRSFRTYFIERVFNYDPIIRAYIASNQEITCDSCDATFGADDLESLKRYRMLCPECQDGTCSVTNLSRKYAEVIEKVDAQRLLPSTELGILQTLNIEPDPLYAADIAAELDVSFQLVGKRAKRLRADSLVNRSETSSGRPQFTITETARSIYFSRDDDAATLDVDPDDDEPPA